jgi:hypothetical protein
MSEGVKCGGLLNYAINDELTRIATVPLGFAIAGTAEAAVAT